MESGRDRRIRPLPPLLVNQIAAGEVIERPASVVKELVENSLDAGATRIRIELEAGGIELIRVSDDGYGIPGDDLRLALSPHATSKIGGQGDLDRIGTLGFRGEALASIASVARVEVRSRTADEAGASVVEGEGERIGEVRPASGPVGTSVGVRNLFFNTPARRKFLKTATTEKTRCMEWIRNLALAHPGVGFEALSEGKVALDVPSGQTPRERALTVLGTELAPQLLEVSADAFDDARGLTLWGLVGMPAVARATNKAQHVFLNGRTIRDKTIQHALREAYRGLIEPGRHPTAVVMIEVAPEAVDVNVHPAKLEVRFRDQSAVHATVHRAVRDALRAADLTPMVDERREPAPFGAGTVGAAEFADRFREVLPGWSSSAPPPPRPEFAPLAAPRPASSILQVHNSYVVTQDEHGVVIIDQHALHERVMFEQLLGRVRKGALERQALLTPAVVEAGADEVDRLDELRPLLGRIGIEADALGERSIGVRTFPTFLFERRVDPVEFMRDLLDRAGDEDFAPDDEQALRDVLDMMACKAAVKAGDRLSDSELSDLIVMRDAVERSSSCPHGRPTSVRLTIGQLEKLFHRS